MGGQQKDFISDIVFFQHQDGMRLKVWRHFLECSERRWTWTLHLHQPGIIFPSWWNVRQKASVATLCVLCVHYHRTGEETLKYLKKERYLERTQKRKNTSRFDSSIARTTLFARRALEELHYAKRGKIQFYRFADLYREINHISLLTIKSFHTSNRDPFCLNLNSVGG